MWKDTLKVGYSYKDSKLYVFRKKSVRVYRLWGKNAGAWMKTRDKPYWIRFRPQHRLVPIYSYWWRKAFEEVPEKVESVLSRYRMRQWHVLQTLNRCGYFALQRAETSPLVLFILSNIYTFNRKVKAGRHYPVINRLLKLKDKEILGFAGFPEEKWFAKFLHKVYPVVVKNLGELFMLRSAMRWVDRDMRKIMMHIPQVNKGIWPFFYSPVLFPHLTPHFILEVSRNREDENFPHSYYLLLSVVYRGYNGRVYSIRQLGRLYAEYIQRDTEILDELAGKNRFPKPPFEGNESIQPIEDITQLYNEGKEMKHCIFSYKREIVEGKFYVYRVVSPERATLALKKKNNIWRLYDMRGFSNRSPSVNAYREVLKWVSNNAPLPLFELVDAENITEEERLKKLINANLYILSKNWENESEEL